MYDLGLYFDVCTTSYFMQFVVSNKKHLNAQLRNYKL